MGSGGLAPCINFGTRWRWVVSFTSRSLYPGEGDLNSHLIGVGWAPEPVWAERWWR